jgi:hypothetical protein
MDKLTITAKLKSPLIVGGGYLTFDALLAAILFEKLQDVDLAMAAIPLRVTDQLYHASAALLEPYDTRSVSFVANMRAMHSLTPELLKKNKHGIVHRRIGLTRRQDFGAVMNTYTQHSAEEITWYAEGDADDIHRLLDPVSFIGKRRGSGFGEVASWSIAQGEFDGIIGPFGSPLRPVPIDRFEGDKSSLRVDAAWKPAYWHPENRAICYAPKLIA